MRHVPGNEFEDDHEETSTPFEPLVVSTQAYLVGNERPYNPNDQSEIIERYLRNEKQRSEAVGVSNDDDHQRQEDLVNFYSQIFKYKYDVVKLSGPTSLIRLLDCNRMGGNLFS